MKKMVITVVFLLMCGTVLAQYAAPENLGASFPVYAGTYEVFEVKFYWDVIDDPDLDYYECFQDGEEVEDWEGTFEFGYALIEMPQDNDFHTTGVRAIYTDGGISDTSTLTYYYSGTAYSYPKNVTIENYPGEFYAVVEFDEPMSGGAGAPTPQEYIYYIDDTMAESSSSPGIDYLELDVGQNESYILAIDVLYSDGHYSSDFRHPIFHRESYMGELSPAEDVMVDEETGILTWSVPGDGDVIGGTVSSLVASITTWEGYVWPSSSPFQFGDDTNHVSTAWFFSAWVHNNLGNDDIERITMGKALSSDPDSRYSSVNVTSVKQIEEASSLDFVQEHFILYDADTSPDCYGDFIALKNIETGYYGVVQVIDVTDKTYSDYTEMNYEYFDVTWWFQTNGSDDFSSAERYYPLYYNIYLDGELIDSVSYEMVTVDKETFEIIVVDSTLSPSGEFEYQFEGLENGESYTAEVEAVYYACVGKADRQEVEFVYVGFSVDEPQTGTSSPVLSNYPNPFKQHTNISFSITKPRHVTLDVYNIKGEKVKTLVDECLEATDYTIEWNGTDNNGKSVSNGVYLYRMSVDNENVISNKMILMR